MQVNFISSKDTGETRISFVWSDSEEIRSGNETDNIIKIFFLIFLKKLPKRRDNIEKRK